MKDYKEVTASLLERRDRYEAEQKKKRKTVLGVAVPLCCVCLIVLMGFLMGPGGQLRIQPEQTVGDALYQGIKDTFDESRGESADDPAANDTVVVNLLEEAPQLMDIALMWDDFVAMTREELTAYYGVDFVPEVPADLEAWENQISGIYKRGGGTGEIYCDRNRLQYSNEDQSREVVLTVAKGRIPVLFGMPTDVEPEKSVIRNREVTVFQMEDGSYFAEFLHGDAGFVLFAHGVSQEELAAILSSIVK